MRRSALVAPITIGSLVLLLCGCIVVKDSPAPGCRKAIGLPMAGGCAGKTAILDLAVQPTSECLTVDVNNCNGGVLEVRNACSEALVLGEVEILPSESASLDVAEAGGDAYAFSRTAGNFSSYVPKENKSVVIAGTLGSQGIEVSFTKTAKLCE